MLVYSKSRMAENTRWPLHSNAQQPDEKTRTFVPFVGLSRCLRFMIVNFLEMLAQH
jgi:hypothetical protein